MADRSKGREILRDLVRMWGETRMVVLTAVAAAVFAAVLIPFKMIPLIPGTTELRPANALPRDTKGQSYIVLYDPAGETETVTLARDLPEGEHRARIAAERGWGQWAIAGWTVSSAANPSGYDATRRPFS